MQCSAAQCHATGCSYEGDDDLQQQGLSVGTVQQQQQLLIALAVGVLVCARTTPASSWNSDSCAYQELRALPAKVALLWQLCCVLATCSGGRCAAIARAQRSLFERVQRVELIAVLL